MKLKLVTAILVLSACWVKQNKQAVQLEWKINAEEPVFYMTNITEIDSTELVSNDVSDSIRKIGPETVDKYLLSKLTNKGDGIIDVIMITPPSDSVINKEDIELRQRMNKGVSLRGSVYAKGGIHSFWVENSKKNIIALFFELPKEPVKVGDSWELAMDYIGNDHNFACDHSYKTNNVTLSEVKQVNGENIAVIKYNLVEHVNGVFYQYSGSIIEYRLVMHVTYTATGEFSIDKGRWISYNGVLHFDQTGDAVRKKMTRFALIRK